MIPYGKDNWRLDTDIGRGAWLAARGYAYCRVDVRGTGSSGGVALDEYTADETRDGYDAVEWAGDAALVERCGRDVGHQLRRVHRDPGRQASPAPPPGDRPVHGHGRPLRRRRPLPRRLRDRQRAVAVRGQPGGDERHAAGRDAAWDRPGWTSGGPGSRSRRRGCSSGCATRPTGRTGARGRWPRTTTRSRSPSTRSAAGWTATWTRRSGCRSGAPPRPGRSSATGSTAGPAERQPGPNIDDLHELVRFLDHHLRGIENGVDAEPPVVWFEREYAPPEPFPAALPGRWRATAAYPHPGRARRPSGGSMAASCRWPGRLRHDRRVAAARGRRRRPIRPQPDHRDARVAVVGRRRPAERPGPRPAPRRGRRPDVHDRASDRRRSRSSASPRSCCTCRSRRRWPRRSCG